MKILSVNDPTFLKYGRIVDNVDLDELIEVLAKTPVTDGVVYEPSIPELEALEACKELSRVTYGEMPIQIGFCNGHNSKLNAVEYHRDSEINIAATDAILILGKREDIAEDFTYETGKMEVFFLPAGTAVEVFATTLHYAPCGVNGNGFQVAIVLPKGTNYPLASKHEPIQDGIPCSEDALITAVNKWLIGHPEGGLDDSAFIGLLGYNLDVTKDE